LSQSGYEQLARSRKLQVIGTIFGGDPGYVRALGADWVIDTKSQHLAELSIGPTSWSIRLAAKIRISCSGC